MPPKITRRALKPLRTTPAASPRCAQPARKGGNSSKSVSSSITSAVSDLKARIRRRIARFFLPLRIGIEHVAEAFPDVSPAVQFATDRILGEPKARRSGDLLLQERHRPIHGEVSQPIRGGRQQSAQQGFVFV